MKKYLLYGLTTLIMTAIAVPLIAQEKNDAVAKNNNAKARTRTNVQQASNSKMMTWTTKSAAAKELAQKGGDYFLNIEFPGV